MFNFGKIKKSEIPRFQNSKIPKLKLLNKKNSTNVFLNY